MWQLETAATNASSGSTFAGFEYGRGTTEGDGEAGTVMPPSNSHVCSREYFPLRKSGLVRFQPMMALCSDIIYIACFRLNTFLPLGPSRRHYFIVFRAVS